MKIFSSISDSKIRKSDKEVQLLRQLKRNTLGRKILGPVLMDLFNRMYQFEVDGEIHIIPLQPRDIEDFQDDEKYQYGLKYFKVTKMKRPLKLRKI